MNLDDQNQFQCPYCCQTNELFVDITGGSHQEFVVDCEVCCAPIIVRLSIRGGNVVSVDVQRENE